jgi:phosphoglycolate phosphatase-like HAD superfamily hydrolase
VDVARVSRDAYAEAFRRVTGRSLVALPQLAGASDSEIFFESLALNEAAPGPGRSGTGNPVAGRAGQSEASDLLARYATELAAAFGARGDQIAAQGRVLPGAREALAAVSRLPGVIQTVLTGAIRQNAVQKLHAFGLDPYLDLEIGGYGSQAYPKGTQILRSLAMAGEKYGVVLNPGGSVYIADSVRDVAAATVAGVRCLAVATGRSTVSELRAAGADPVLLDLSDTSRVVAAISR